MSGDQQLNLEDIVVSPIVEKHSVSHVVMAVNTRGYVELPADFMKGKSKEELAKKVVQIWIEQLQGLTQEEMESLLKQRLEQVLGL